MGLLCGKPLWFKSEGSSRVIYYGAGRWNIAPTEILTTEILFGSVQVFYSATPGDEAEPNEAD